MIRHDFDPESGDVPFCEACNLYECDHILRNKPCDCEDCKLFKGDHHEDTLP